MESATEKKNFDGEEARTIGKELGIPDADSASLTFPSNRRKIVKILARGERCAASMRLSYERNRSWHVYLDQIDKRPSNFYGTGCEQYRTTYRLYSRNMVARDFDNTINEKEYIQRDKSAQRRPEVANILRTRAQRVSAAIGLIDDGTLLAPDSPQRAMIQIVEEALPLLKKRPCSQSLAKRSYAYHTEAQSLGEALGLGGAKVASWFSDKETGVAMLTACSDEFAASFISQLDPSRPASPPALLHAVYDSELKTMHLNGKSDHSLHAMFKVTSERKLELINPIPIENQERHTRKLSRIVDSLSAVFA